MATGKKVTLLRWTITRAASEFGRSRDWLTSEIKRRGILPGGDKLFSTEQVCAAVFGSLDGEKLRQAVAGADLTEIERDKAIKSIMTSDQAYQAWSGICTSVRQRLLGVAPKLKQRLAQKAEAEVETILDGEMREVLDELSKAPEYYPDDDEVVAEDDAIVPATAEVDGK